ncbi:MAG: hypothetical protein ACYCWW_00105 [Deltaproteobacteria bacterium]
MTTVLAILAIIVLVPGGFVAVAMAVLGYRAISLARKGDPDWHPSWRVLLWARVWDFILGIDPKLHLGILHQEGASTLRAPTPEEAAFLVDLWRVPPLVYPLGDVGDSRGPSFGPGQVLRVNVLALSDGGQLAGKGASMVSPLPFYAAWLKPSSPSALALHGQEFRALFFSARMLADAVRRAGGDAATAAAIYNGGPAGPENSEALAYAGGVSSYLSRLS